MIVEQHARGDIYGHARFGPGAVKPMRRRFNRGSKHPIGDFHDQARFLGHGQKPVGCHDAAIGHAPAQQCFDQRCVKRLRLHLRLKPEFKFITFDRASQTLFRGEFRGRGLEQVRREYRQLAPTQGLRTKQRGICRFQ